MTKTGWISDGEKYALVAISAKLDEAIEQGQIAPNLWVLADQKFDLPSHWHDWLGSLRAEQVQDCNLFLLSK